MTTVKHSEPIVREAIATVRRATEWPEQLIPTLLSSAVILADHAEWTYEELERRVRLWMEGFERGARMRDKERIAELEAEIAALKGTSP